MSLCWYPASVLWHFPATVAIVTGHCFTSDKHPRICKRSIWQSLPSCPFAGSWALPLCQKPGQHSQHYFGITKEIILIRILETIQYVEEMGMVCDWMSVQIALWHFPFLLDNFIKLDVIKKKVSLTHTTFFNLDCVSDVKAKGKNSYWRFRVISAGEKVNTFVRHSVSSSYAKVQQCTCSAGCRNSSLPFFPLQNS